MKSQALFIFLVLVSGLAQADLASDLLQASDLSRGGTEEGITWDIKIDTKEDGDASTRDFKVQAKGFDAYVEATAPARYKGEVYIFNDRDMWFYKPSIKKPVSISSRQKLSGQAANGDIASTHYAKDYSATLLGEATVRDEKTFILLLKAKRDNLTYDQIKYYVSEKNRLAVKAEFLTLQGQVFKIGSLEYNNHVMLKGKNTAFVSQLVIQDAKFPENISTITYTNPKITTVNSKLFNVNNLSR